MAFWATEVKPSKTAQPLILERRVVIKQAALVISKSSSEPCVLSVCLSLMPTAASTSSVCVGLVSQVSVKGSDQQFVVCRMHEGRMEHCTLELPFSPQDMTQLHLKGPHTIHLTGEPSSAPTRGRFVFQPRLRPTHTIRFPRARR